MRTSLPALGVSTRRTYLRQLQETDLPSLLRLHNDPTTKKYAWVDNLESAESNLEWIKDQKQLYRKGLGLYAIESRAGKKFLGLCGLRVRYDLDGLIDIAYRILPDFRQLGYGTESARAMLKYGFQYLHLHKIVAQVHRDNFPSRRIMYRLGFHTTDTEKNWILYTASGSESNPEEQ